MSIQQGGRLLTLFIATALSSMTAAHAVRASQVAPPTITIGAVPSAPVVDGEIVPHEWAGAAYFGGFINVATGWIATPPTRAYFAADEDTLFLAVQCSIPRGKEPKSTATKRDGQVWADDSIELYLVTPADVQYQFIVSAAGVMFDKRNIDPGWDGTWRAATRVLEGRYEIEMAIPLSDMGLSAPPESFRFNLCRNYVVPTSQWTSVAWTGSKYGNRERFGKLLIDSSAPILGVGGLGDTESGRVRLATHIVRQPQPGQARVVSEILKPGGQVIGEPVTQLSRPDSRTLVNQHEPLDAGHYILRMRMYDPQGQMRTHLEWPFEVLPAVRVAVERSISPDKRTLSLTARKQSRPGEDDAQQARARLADAEGTVVRQTAAVEFVSGEARLALDLTGLAEGKYRLTTTAIGPSGTELARSEDALSVPAPPVWLGTREGLIEGVPAPWTPPEQNGRTIKVWGRDYEFSRGPVPAQVTSRGEELLFSPAHLMIDGRRAKWTLLGSEPVGEGPQAIRLNWRGRGVAEGLTATCEVTFEGLVRVDVTLPAGRRLDDLAFVMPVKRSRALYLHDSDSMWGTVRNTRRVPDTARTWSVRRHVWLLDNDRGICWFHGMRGDWPLKQPDEAVSLVPGGERVDLRVNYVDAPRAFDEPTTFTFGVLAAPANPKADASDGLRVWQGARYGYDARHYWGASVTYPGQGHINLKQGTCEFWLRPRFDTDSDCSHLALKIEYAGYRGIYLGYTPPPRRMRVYLVDGSPGLLFRDLKWAPKQGEWAHIAFTWGDDFRVYVNGGLKSTDKLQGSIPARDAPLKIQIGDSGFAIDELRISDVCRTRFDISRPPQADEHTLLVDHFDQVQAQDGVRWSVPEKAQPNVRGRYSPASGQTPGRFGGGLRAWQVEPVTTIMDRAADLGVKQMTFAWPNWATVHADLFPSDPEGLKRLVDKAHQLGMKFVLYVSCELSDKSPLWDYYQDDWVLQPRPYPSRDGTESSYRVCTMGSYPEWFFHHLGKLMDEYDVDGFFIDGGPGGPCQNADHGCGYVREDGKRAPTVDVWAARQFMLRMYRLIHSRKPDGVLDLHKSSQWSPWHSILADSGVDGEQLMPLRPGDRPPLEMLPLEVFRAQMTGRQFGLPLDFLAYDGAPFKPEQAITYALVHGVSWRPWVAINQLEVAGKYWGILDDLKVTRQQFVPYWDAGAVLDCEPEQVLTSAYLQEDRALLVCANFGDTPATARIKLKPQGLGFARFTARDAITSEKLDVVDSEIQLECPSWRVRLVLVEPAG